MNITEKLEFLKNPADLHLFKEGVFWVAYEHNAYFIWKMKGYKPNKKFIKSIQQEVVSVGFPENVLQTQFLDFQLQYGTRYISENHILIEIGNQTDQNEFQKWKNALKNTNNTNQISINTLLQNEKTLAEQILHFDLSNATPIDCMNFINQLKSSINP